MRDNSQRVREIVMTVATCDGCPYYQPDIEGMNNGYSRCDKMDRLIGRWDAEGIHIDCPLPFEGASQVPSPEDLSAYLNGAEVEKEEEPTMDDVFRGAGSALCSDEDSDVFSMSCARSEAVPTLDGLPETWLRQAELSPMEKEALEAEEDRRIQKMLDEFGVDFDTWDSEDK